MAAKLTERLLGSAEWIGATVQFRLARGVDPTRERRDLRDYCTTVLGEPMSKDRDEAKRQGKRVAHAMSVTALELRAAPPPKTCAGQSVEKWCDLWHADRVRSHVVVDDEDDRSCLRCHVFEHIGHRPIADVNRQEIEAIVAYLDRLIVEGKLGWKRAANVWSVVKTIFHDACRSKPSRGLRVRDDDPTAGVEPPTRGDKRTKTFLYPSEFMALITSPAIWEASGKMVAMARNARRWMRLFILSTYLQMRAGELRAVRWEDFDFEHWTLTVKRAAKHKTSGKVEKDPKQGRTRTFEIEPALRPLLWLMREEAGGDDAKGRIIAVPPEKALSARLRDYCERAGLKRADLYADTTTQAPLTFHDLRATGVTWRAARGDNPFAIQDTVGHTDLKTTQGYMRKVAALGDAFGTPFQAIPALVLGDRKAARPKAVPKLSQEIAKYPKRQSKMASPAGFEHDSHRKSPGKSQYLGPSVPSHAAKRNASRTGDGTAVTTALRRALDAAITAGDSAAAVELAARLAGDTLDVPSERFAAKPARQLPGSVRQHQR